MSIRYRKILIPLDGSPLAERVLDHIGWLATPGKTELILVSVFESWRYAMTGPELTMPDTLPYIREGIEETLRGQQERLRRAGHRVTAQVVDGDPAQVILEMAQTTGADLIAMSTHGRSGFVRWALGSVAERVIHGAPIPVFLVRAGTTTPQDKLQTILLPLDGSAVAERALPEAQTLASINGVRLLLLQVIQAMDEGNRRLLFPDEVAAASALADARAEATTYLAGIAQQTEAAGVACTYRVAVADPANAICTTAAEEGADLIVMGTHGRSGLKRWVYGSVANKVLRGATCPLLLVHTLAED
ncbi:MAG: universal stress protein [Caldilineaceae bacterium]